MKFLVILLLALGFSAFAPKPKLTTAKLSPTLTVGVPEGFVALADGAIAQKYPAPRKPLAVYSDNSGRIDFSVATRPTTFGSPDYKVLQQIYKASILRLYSKVEFLRDEVRTVNGREMVSFEFVSTLADNARSSRLAPLKKYQFVQYTVQKDQLYVFTFDAPAEEKTQWQPVAQAAMAAVVLK